MAPDTPTTSDDYLIAIHSVYYYNPPCSNLLATFIQTKILDTFFWMVS